MITDQEIEVYAIQTAALMQDGMQDRVQCLVKLIGDMPYEDAIRILQRSVEINRERYETALDERDQVLEEIRIKTFGPIGHDQKRKPE